MQVECSGRKYFIYYLPEVNKIHHFYWDSSFFAKRGDKWFFVKPQSYNDNNGLTKTEWIGFLETNNGVNKILTKEYNHIKREDKLKRLLKDG